MVTVRTYVPSGNPAGRAAKMPTMVAPTAQDAILAVDVGGTKMAVGIVVGDRLVHSARKPTLADGEPEAAFEVLRNLTDEAVAASPTPPVAIGIGCGGPMQWPEGRVSPLNIPAWRDFPLRSRLEEHHGIPARIHNDAVCLALAEHHMGAGRGHRNMLGMVVSTGVGGGFIVDGRVINGASGNAGHVGHVIVEPEGIPCPCGGRGCLEGEARGPVLSRKATALGWQGETTVDLAADAERGHPIAIAVLEQAGRHIGLAVASIVATMDLTAVVIGGGVANCGEHLWGPLRSTYAEHARLPWCHDVLITRAQAQPEPGLLGAAALWR
jgi:glucokinase